MPDNNAESWKRDFDSLAKKLDIADKALVDLATLTRQFINRLPDGEYEGLGELRAEVRRILTSISESAGTPDFRDTTK